MAKKNPDMDTVWCSCRESRGAEVSLEALADAKLQSAAIRLGFAKNEDGRLEKECPYCQEKVGLFTTKDGDIRASGSLGSVRCPAISSIQQWLRDEGYQS